MLLKKIVWTCTLCTAFLYGNAQWTTSGNDINNSNSGNVGIGTSSPQYKLDINGTLRATGNVQMGAGATLSVDNIQSTSIYPAINTLGNGGTLNVGDVSGWVGSGAHVRIFHANNSGRLYVGLSANHNTQIYHSPQTANSFYSWHRSGTTYDLFELGEGTVRMPVLATGTGNGTKMITVGEDGLIGSQSISANTWSFSGNDLVNANSGNIRIGSVPTDANYKLQVGGALRLLNTNELSFVPNDGGGNATIRSNYPLFINTNTNSTLYLGGSNPNMLAVFPNGNVSLGTTADPGVKLYVAGATRTTDKVLIATTDQGLGNLQISGGMGQIQGTPNADVWHYMNGTYASGTPNNWYFGIGNTSNNGAFRIQNASNGTYLNFARDGALTLSSQFNVTADGKVGIGTATPQAKLAVNGDIFSKKVKVTQTGWPDYVFDENYRLPSLAEVEQFINKNKHLPEVPTAAEVEKNGLDLGDNQALLLKKIEELTLYILSLKKENDIQTKEIELLKQQNSKSN